MKASINILFFLAAASSVAVAKKPCHYKWWLLPSGRYNFDCTLVECKDGTISETPCPDVKARDCPKGYSVITITPKKTDPWPHCCPMMKCKKNEEPKVPDYPTNEWKAPVVEPKITTEKPKVPDYPANEWKAPVVEPKVTTEKPKIPDYPANEWKAAVVEPKVTTEEPKVPDHSEKEWKNE